MADGDVGETGSDPTEVSFDVVATSGSKLLAEELVAEVVFVPFANGEEVEFDLAAFRSDFTDAQMDERIPEEERAEFVGCCVVQRFVESKIGEGSA